MADQKGMQMPTSSELGLTAWTDCPAASPGTDAGLLIGCVRVAILEPVQLPIVVRDGVLARRSRAVA